MKINTSPDHFLIKKSDFKDLFNIMKICLFLLFAFTLQLMATNTNAQDAIIELKSNSVTVSQLISEIEKQTDYLVIYSNREVNTSRTVSLKNKSDQVSEYLNQTFSGTDIGYDFEKNYIVLSKKAEETASILTNLTQTVQQQGKTVRGTVTDSNGEPVIGATIVVKDNPSQGTVTDIDGNYSITNISETTTLIFSFIGMRTQELSIGGQTIINVIMEEEAIGLEEIVATAFGIKKTQRELTYSTQQVGGEDLVKVKAPDLLSALQGKVAGVSINLTSGEVGRSPQVRIRGNRSLRDNNPLYVIDGMPVPGLLDFDPNNIESINILKGPAASALYGLMASNGALIITTKSGEGFEGKPTISFETHYSIDNVGYLAPLQRVYAQGEKGVFKQDTWQTWGPKISEMEPYVNQLGELEEPGSYENDKDFYETGNTFSNNVSFKNAGTFGNYIVSLGHTQQNGIIPNSKYNRTSALLGGQYVLSSKFKVNATLNFIDRYSRDQRDQNDNDNYLRGLRDTPPSYNLKGKPYADPSNPAIQIYWRGGQNNPYWLVNNNYRKINRTQIFGNMFLEYKLNPSLSLNYRIGMNRNIGEAENFDNMGTASAWRQIPPIGGRIGISKSVSTQINSNAFALYDKKINEVFNFNFVLGNEIINNNDRIVSGSGTDFIVQGWNNLVNTTHQTSSNSDGSNRTVGFYGNLNLGWKDIYFINASGRNDIVSNMPRGNRSFFYPSIGTSIVLSEAIPVLPKFISFAKLRATYAEVGQAGPRNVNNIGFAASSPGFTFPYDGLSSYTLQGQRINPNLRPENTKSYEIGTDLRFINNRIILDYAYYKSISKDQIFSVPLAPSTGYSSELRNSGSIESSGHEVSLTIIPVSSRNFHWEFTSNFNKWESIVKELAPGIERINFTGEIVAEAGYPFPSIIGRRQYRDPVSGERVFNDKTGLPMLDPELRIIGNPIPDFEMSFINSISYKNITLSAQVDWRSGGDSWMQSFNEGAVRGTGAVTLNRDILQDPVGKKGSIKGGELVVTGDNDIPIYHNLDYYQALGGWNITQEQLQDQTFVRLREVNLSFDIPQKMLPKSFIKSASFYLTGRNLFIITNSYYDPEVLNTETGGNMVMGSERSNTPPQLRNIGFGLNINF